MSLFNGKDNKNLPPPIKRRRYYTPQEVRFHNSATDCWISMFHEVYDLTNLIQSNYGYLVDPIIKEAGNDISHWFNNLTKDVRFKFTFKPKELVIKDTCLKSYYTPNGTYLNIPPDFPDSSWNYNFVTPWWKDDSLKIGKLTHKTRKIRIINVLSGQDDIIEVCSEETINEILDRYLPLNEHAESYTWKRLQRPLDMDLTLLENDIPDETQEYINLDIDPDDYIPAIHIYFNDDLTEA